MNIKLLNDILETPCISGYEQRIFDQIPKIIDLHIGKAASIIKIHRTPHGIALVTGTDPKLALAAHVDTIGLRVNYIDDSGFIYFKCVGGWDPLVLFSQQVTIHTSQGPITGVISRVATHMMTEDEQSKIPDTHEVYIDIGMASAEKVKLLVSVGDPITVGKFETKQLGDNLIIAPGLDDRLGAYIVIQSVLEAAESQQSLIGFLCSYEESGYSHGLSRLIATVKDHIPNPNALVAIDVTQATDTPDVKKAKHGDVSLFSGATIARGSFLDEELAKHLGVSFDLPQFEMTANYSCTDLDWLPLIFPHYKYGVVSIPLRYMHTTVEMANIKMVDSIVDGLLRFIRNNGDKI